MAEETTSGDPYDVVLADLKAKRAQLDQAIAAIEAVRSGISQSNQEPSFVGGAGLSNQIQPGVFHGMSILEASKRLLDMRKKALGTQEITEALKEGGVVFSTETPGNTVGSVLHREASKANGTVISVGRGTWALASGVSNPGRFRRKTLGEALYPDGVKDTPAGTES